MTEQYSELQKLIDNADCPKLYAIKHIGKSGFRDTWIEYREYRRGGEQYCEHRHKDRLEDATLFTNSSMVKYHYDWLRKESNDNSLSREYKIYVIGLTVGIVREYKNHLIVDEISMKRRRVNELNREIQELENKLNKGD